MSAVRTRRVAQYMIDRVGLRYERRNVIDLARVVLPTPPIPIRFRRRMLALGSGDPLPDDGGPRGSLLSPGVLQRLLASRTRPRHVTRHRRWKGQAVIWGKIIPYFQATEIAHVILTGAS